MALALKLNLGSDLMSTLKMNAIVYKLNLKILVTATDSTRLSYLSCSILFVLFHLPYHRNTCSLIWRVLYQYACIDHSSASIILSKKASTSYFSLNPCLIIMRKLPCCCINLASLCRIYCLGFFCHGDNHIIILRKTKTQN